MLSPFCKIFITLILLTSCSSHRHALPTKTAMIVSSIDEIVVCNEDYTIHPQDGYRLARYNKEGNNLDLFILCKIRYEVRFSSEKFSCFLLLDDEESIDIYEPDQRWLVLTSNCIPLKLVL
jgi:hypothetical protein